MRAALEGVTNPPDRLHRARWGNQYGSEEDSIVGRLPGEPRREFGSSWFKPPGLGTQREILSTDAAFATAMRQLAVSVGTAVRQAHPVLTGDEVTFLDMGKPTLEGTLTSKSRTRESLDADILVHEAIPGSREMVLLPDHIHRPGWRMLRRPADPPTRDRPPRRLNGRRRLEASGDMPRVRVGSGPHRRPSGAPRGPGSVPPCLLCDMATAAIQLLDVRKGWPRIARRLAAATEATAMGPDAPG
jgi:hypothetical protein